MASLLSKPEAPAEDPDAAALREAEEARAKAETIRAQQEQLQTETNLSGNNFGIMSLRRRFRTSLLGSG